MKGDKNHNFGKHLSEEQKQKIREKLTGQKRSEESKKRMSKAKKGENNPMFGRNHTAETKKLIGDKQRGEKNHRFGKKQTEEFKNSKRKSYRITTSDGTVKTITGLKRWCDENSVPYKTLLKCISKGKSYLKYDIQKIEKV
jgi:hypothetical protein